MAIIPPAPTGPRPFIFIGRSGCGKGTQAEMLIEYIKQVQPEREVLYVQTGLEFREFIHGTTLSQQLAKRIGENGGLVPEFLAIYFWSHKITEAYKEGSHLIIDGTPRKPQEANILDSLFGFYGLPKPDVIYIDVSRQWAHDRLMARKRDDDTEESITRRLDWFDSDVLPAMEYYKTHADYRFHAINGERTKEEIHADIVKRIDLH